MRGQLGGVQVEKLITITLLVFSFLHAFIVLGGVVIMLGAPDPGDEYLLLYGLIALPLSGVAFFRQLSRTKRAAPMPMFVRPFRNPHHPAIKILTCATQSDSSLLFFACLSRSPARG